MARQFGIVTTSTGVTSIVIQSLQYGTSVETANAMDENGVITDINGYGKKTSVTIKGLLDGSIGVAAGDIITVGSDSYIITSVQVSESNTGYAEADISAEGAPGVTPVGPSSGSGSGSTTTTTGSGD